MGKVVSKVTGALGLTADPRAGSGAMGQAFSLQREALKRLDEIKVPTVEEQQIALQFPELILSTPEERLKDTNLAEVAADPALRGMQAEALKGISDLAEQGYSEEDRARMRAMQRQIGADEQARQASILAGMAERGALDSGAQLAAQLQSSQGAADRAAQQADRLASNAAQARQSALGQKAQMAGQLRSQDVGEQTNVARARDAIAQFNAGVSARDTMARQAQEAARVSAANQQEMANKALIQQNFQNQFQKATGAAGALGNMATQQQNAAQMQAQAAQQQAAGIRGLVTSGAKAAIAKFSDERVKKNITDIDNQDVKEMLDSLSPKSFEYKGGSERQSGIMAQDLEKSKLGSELVEEVSGVKAVNIPKATNTLMASLASLNDRLSKLEEGKAYGDGGRKPMMSEERQPDIMSRFGLPPQQPTPAPMMSEESTPPLLARPMRSDAERMDDLVASKTSDVINFDPVPREKSLPMISEVADEYAKEKAAEKKPEADKKDKKNFTLPTHQEETIPMAQLQQFAAIQAAAPQGNVLQDMMGRNFQDGGMNYENGGQGVIIDSGEESYAGDQLKDRINDGEMVLNLDQQEMLNDLLKELAMRRTDEQVNEGMAQVNEPQQQALFETIKGERPVEALPQEDVVEAEGIQRLLKMLGK